MFYNIFVLVHDKTRVVYQDIYMLSVQATF